MSGNNAGASAIARNDRKLYDGLFESRGAFGLPFFHSVSAEGWDRRECISFFHINFSSPVFSHR